MQLGELLVIGVSVNNVTGISGKSYAVEDLLHAAVEAEAMQFDAIWVHDAPLGRRTLAALDPVTVLAAVAAQTKTLRLGNGILTPQVRNRSITPNNRRHSLRSRKAARSWASAVAPGPRLC